MNTDYKYYNELNGLLQGLDTVVAHENQVPPCYPLDSDVRDIIIEICSFVAENASEYALYQKQKEVQNLWRELLTKAIQCLRFFDKREPFIKNEEKHPLAYGIREIDDYYAKYKDFEKVMYGGVPYYRDHVVHVFRVWMLGCVILLRDNCTLLANIKIDEVCQINIFEKLSIWTIIALTHDLGYPLEKASKIIDKTKDMMTAFVSNPIISMDLSFNGVQNSMNDFILRLMSSKMIGKNEENKPPFVARLQPKYYFKFQKSLEHNMHGVLSAIIIYKLLLYFLESDFTINEDYIFNEEEVRQFYIRRDILRAIASHTCVDVYQMNQYLFSFLLIVCDEAQTWGRKGISELYVNKNAKYDFKDIKFSAEDGTWEIFDRYELNDQEDAKNILLAFQHQCLSYISIFRDGQDTSKRDFDFKWEMSLKVKLSEFRVVFSAKKDENIRIILTKHQEDENLSLVNKTVKAFDQMFNDQSNLKKNPTKHEWAFVKANI